jgi:hypothetical protein
MLRMGLVTENTAPARLGVVVKAVPRTIII